MNSSFELSPRNAAAIARYAELVGLTPEAFLNAFLAEFLVNRFSDPRLGDAEPFLGGFTFKEEESAQRVAAWIRERLRGQSSIDTLEVEIFPVGKGGFKIRAAWIGDGRMYEL